MRLIEPTSGTIKLDGRDVTDLSKGELRPYRREMQIIFQDPFLVARPAHDRRPHCRRAAYRARHWAIPTTNAANLVAELFERVGLRAGRWTTIRTSFPVVNDSASALRAHWHLNPKLIVGDEPVSALDVSIQAQVINLLLDLQAERKLSYLFISHNLAVVEHISHKIAVMYLGSHRRIRLQGSHLSKSKTPLHKGPAVGGTGAGPNLEARKAGVAGRRS